MIWGGTGCFVPFVQGQGLLHARPPSPGQATRVKVNNTQPVASCKAFLSHIYEMTAWETHVPFALLHRHTTQLTYHPSSNHERCAGPQVRSRNSGSPVAPSAQFHMGIEEARLALCNRRLSARRLRRRADLAISMGSTRPLLPSGR
jgi:hypothetical protein